MDFLDEVLCGWTACRNGMELSGPVSLAKANPQATEINLTMSSIQSRGSLNESSLRKTSTHSMIRSG